MKQQTKRITRMTGLLVGLIAGQQAMAAIALDRTRVIFLGADKSISLNIRNENARLPFLAQAWLEDSDGNKITSPLVVVPPLQRVEPGTSSQLEVKAQPQVAMLPQDRESLFYFNLREIPPKSNKPNTLQLALQTRIKFFYRPPAIQMTRSQMSTPWQDKLTLTRQGGHYEVNNPTPYYISLVAAGSSIKELPVTGFTPQMVAPKSHAILSTSAAGMGRSPVLTYINDYGGSKALTFQCVGDQCHVTQDSSVKVK